MSATFAAAAAANNQQRPAASSPGQPPLESGVSISDPHALARSVLRKKRSTIRDAASVSSANLRAEASGAVPSDDRSDTGEEDVLRLAVDHPEAAAARINLEFVHNSIMDHIRDSALLNELIIYVPFVVIFILISMVSYNTEKLHMSIGALSYATSPRGIFPLQETINRTAWAQVEQNATEFLLPDDMTFLQLGTKDHFEYYLDFLAYKLFNCSGQLGYTTLGSILPPAVKAQTVPIGALRLRTQRVTNDSCTIASAVQSSSSNASTDTCYASSIGKEQTSGTCVGRDPRNLTRPLWKYVPCSAIRGGTTTTTEFHAYHCGGNLIDIPFTTTCADARMIVASLLNTSCPFIDISATRFFIAEFIMYSMDNDAYLSSKQIVEISGGGGVTTDMQNRIFLVVTNRRITTLILDFVFLSLVLYYCIKFFLDWRHFYLTNGKVLAYFANLWTIVELFNVVTYVAMFVLRFWWWYLSTITDTAILRNGFPVELEALLFIFSQMRYALTFNFLLTFLKFIKYLKISDRLGIISITFEKAQADVLGLLFLFIVIVVGFAVTGNILFGTALPAFASLDRSFAALMFMLLGVLDYDAMKTVSPVLAGAFFWSFLILCFFLLLNFICAVISNAFAAAQNDQFVMPLSDSLQLVLEEVVFSLRPSTLAYKFRLLRRGKSVGTALSDLGSVLNDRLAKMKMNYPDQLEFTASVQEVFEWCSVPMRRDVGKILAFKWRHLHLENEMRQETLGQQLLQERSEAVAKGVGIAVKRVKEQTFEVETRLERISALGDDLIGHLFSRVENFSRQQTSYDRGASFDVR